MSTYSSNVASRLQCGEEFPGASFLGSNRGGGHLPVYPKSSRTGEHLRGPSPLSETNLGRIDAGPFSLL
ncbi:hypothetical protein OIU74_008418, partial [Salix koriyanagi]